MDMVPIHYLTEKEKPISRCEVKTFEDISRAIIDKFEKRHVVDVADDGAVSCRTCDGDCGHENKIRRRLHSITGHGGDEQQEKDTGTDAYTDTETEPATADD